MRERPRLAYLAAAAALIAAGLVWRLAPLGLPAFPLKYGGSALWGAMVYCLAAAAAPRRPVRWTLGLSMLVAAAIELFRLVHAPALDAFRLTLPGALLLGRIFSPWNLLAYAIGIGVAGAVDHALRPVRDGSAGSAPAGRLGLAPHGRQSEPGQLLDEPDAREA